MLLLYNLTIWPMTSDNPTKHLTRSVSENMEGRLEDMNLYICLYIYLYIHFMYRLRNNRIVTKHIFSAIFPQFYIIYELRYIIIFEKEKYIWKKKERNRGWSGKIPRDLKSRSTTPTFTKTFHSKCTFWFYLKTDLCSKIF